ncbi:MAG TPA: class I SAM-dependent methyltransferase [Vicinamibacterales bacterium]|nr:class I SAM-dependent methyltransferase [Vicinamibacterales bacterium]
MRECSKSVARRLSQPAFSNRYFVGHGIDIGGRPDPLGLYAAVFTRLDSVRTWDIEDGDAQALDGVPDAAYDFVHSSHCLEHLPDPGAALARWCRVVKPGGYLVITVPDEDLYEQGQFPSTFNADHRWTFTIFKTTSWSGRSINIVHLVTSLGAPVEILKIEKLDATYNYALPRFDQTLSPVVESAIEFVLRRRPDAEVAAGGRLPGDADVDPAVRIHFNQYRNDAQALKRGNATSPPFRDDRPLRS